MVNKKIGVDELGEPTYANETITPDEAQAYLDLYLRNRSIRKMKVGEYSDAMELGTGSDENPGGWFLNGEGIAFDWDGNPMNGAHRFRACVKAGKPFRSLVARGCDPAGFMVTDSTASRQFRDDLAIKGIGWASQSGGLLRKVAYWNQVADKDALTRNVTGDKGRGGLAGLHSFHYPRQELHQMWDQIDPVSGTTYGKEVTETVQECVKWNNDFPGDRGAMLFVYWLLTREGNNPETVRRFFTILTYGSEDKANRVLLKLRRMLDGTDVSRERELKMKNKRQETHAYWLLANWNRWVSMAQLPSFNLPGENGTVDNPFPPLRRVR